MVPDWRIDGTTTFREALARGAAAPVTAPPIGHEDIAFLQYTGGTTGVAKGAMLTHRNMLANLEQTGIWVSGKFVEGAEIVIAPLPMYHIFCLTSTLSFMKWGSLIVLITNPRDLPGFVKELRKWKWSVMTGRQHAVQRPAQHARIWRARLFVGEGRRRGRRGSAKGGRASAGRRSPGGYITEAYGLTESSPGASANPLGQPWNGTIGLPFPSTDVTIRDDDFNELPVWTGDRRHRAAHGRDLPLAARR